MKIWALKKAKNLDISISHQTRVISTPIQIIGVILINPKVRKTPNTIIVAVAGTADHIILPIEEFSHIRGIFTCCSRILLAPTRGQYCTAVVWCSG